MSSDRSAVEPEIHLEPFEAERRKLAQRRWVNVVAYPLARLAGNGLLVLCALLHNLYVLGEVSGPGFITLAGGIVLYSLVSWLILWRWYEPAARVDLGDVFMALDVVAWTFVIYGTGGERSWLYVALFVRAADQRVASARRVLGFGALSVGCYAGLLLYLAVVDGRAIAWPAEAAKLFIVAAAHIYLALVTQTAARLRTKLVAAIRLAREALATRRETAERYRTLFETVNDPILTAALDGTITGVNRALEAASGYSRDELVGSHFARLTTPAVAEATRERLRRLVAGESLGAAEIVGIHKDGAHVPYEVRSALLRDADGQPAGVVAVYRDIRERKRVEEELWRARDAAERGNRAKSQFLANMSHELRTPLNSILGFSGVLLRRQDGELTPRQVSFIESMVQSATHLLHVISSVLDLSRLEAGKADIALEDVDLATLVRESVDLMRPLAAAKGLELVVDIAEALPPTRADRTKIRQVLLNLLSNAVKFTARGQVTVTLRPRPDGVQITVRDTGPGIPESDLPRLFEPFRDTPLGREAGGTGLGLAISKSFVELHGGSIWAETSPKQGSAFHVTLPAFRQGGRDGPP